MQLISSDIIDQLCERDTEFVHLKEQYGIAPDWTRQQGFSTLIHIILEQQVSLESAKSAFLKLKDKIQIISPERLLELSDEELRACYFSRQKTKYSRELAMAIVNKQLNLETLEHKEEEKIRAELTAIKGIGNWTADIYLIFCLNHPNIFPVGDIAAINSAKEQFDLNTKEEVVERSQMWRPFKTAATKMLWHAYLCKRNRSVDY